MKLEEQVVSLELAKKLKELGVKQESLFYWKSFYTGDAVLVTGKPQKSNKYNSYSAFTVAELGEMLPWLVEVAEQGYFLNMVKNGKKEWQWDVWYELDDDILESVEAESEANARASMLIYLLENNLINQ
jgi:hypothetical protein